MYVNVNGALMGPALNQEHRQLVFKRYGLSKFHRRYSVELCVHKYANRSYEKGSENAGSYRYTNTCKKALS